MKAVVNLSELRLNGMELQHSGVRVRAGAGKAGAVPLLVQLTQDAAIRQVGTPQPAHLALALVQDVVQQLHQLLLARDLGQLKGHCV